MICSEKYLINSGLHYENFMIEYVSSKRGSSRHAPQFCSGDGKLHKVCADLKHMGQHGNRGNVRGLKKARWAV